MRAAFALMALLSGIAACRPGPGAQRSVTAWRDLDALWFRERGEVRLSGTTRLRATATPSREGAVRVVVLEEYAGATGAQWRASVWLAAFLASQILDRDLTENRFNISVGGIVDGPSAGALMAVGFLAALTGAPVRPDASVTGALAPDGSLLPVEGIPEKLPAAQRAGKRIVGIPAGQARTTDARGETVDVVARGRALGIRVVEVEDLYDAYALLTGRRIERPAPVDPARMRLGRVATAALRARARALLDRGPRDAEEPVAEGARAQAERARRKSVAHLASGQIAAAYIRAIQAAALESAVTWLGRLGGDVRSTPWRRRVEGTALSIGQLENELSAAARRPPTASLLSAFGAAARARGCLEVARTLVEIASRIIGSARGPLERALRALQAHEKVFVAALYLAFADLAVERARDFFRTRDGEGSLRLEPGRLRRTAASLVSAASGNVHYVEALLLSDTATTYRQTIERVRAAFAQHERSYLCALQLAHLALSLRDADEKDRFSELLRLTAAAVSYVDSALVIAKYYFLGAALPGVGEKRRQRRAEALAVLLRRAETDARAAAAQAVARVGTILREARLFYQAAVGLAAGSGGDRLRALRFYWRSGVASRLAAWISTR
jgi:hypothetical protein